MHYITTAIVKALVKFHIRAKMPLYLNFFLGKALCHMKNLIYCIMILVLKANVCLSLYNATSLYRHNQAVIS